MATLTPDPTYYPSPRMAMQAPPGELAYAVVLNPDDNGRPDALAVMDVDPGSSTYGQVVGRVDMPGMGDELHHLGWNAYSLGLALAPSKRQMGHTQGHRHPGRARQRGPPAPDAQGLRRRAAARYGFEMRF